MDIEVQPHWHQDACSRCGAKSIYRILFSGRRVCSQCRSREERMFLCAFEAANGRVFDHPFDQRDFND